MAATDFIERYAGGEYQQVWQELIALGDRVREEPYWSEARAVANETMRRVRENVGRLIPRLEHIGYRFARDRPGLIGDSQPPHVPPDGNEPELIDDYERRFGVTVPLSLRAFYEVVGAVDLRGRHPDWRGQQDPLQIYGLDMTRNDASGWDGPVEKIFLCPCPLMKDGYSGVGPLYLEPGRAADGPVGFEGGSMSFTFVEYLRNAFRWGGFAGCVQTEDEFASDWLELPSTARSQLAADLMPL
ncbi:hypothetical protein [Zavarzinella formosa]|uniref:hypothetical protein n=1 Tax=Zavarzinella formosa TaxID=360055 RepID=UPI000372C344|nr:hypothetical protein [Zavarzinella formosa]